MRKIIATTLIIVLALFILGCQQQEEEQTDYEPEVQAPPEEQPAAQTQAAEDTDDEAGDSNAAEAGQPEEEELLNLSMKITSPNEGDIIRDYFSVETEFASEMGPDKVMLYIDDLYEETDFTVPFKFNLNHEDYREGNHVIRAVLYDNEKNTVSDEVEIYISRSRLECGDGICIEPENCKKCPRDCTCGVGNMCAPDEPGADKMGCVRYS